MSAPTVYRTRTSIRQRQVLTAMSFGKSYQTISDELGISMNSTRIHIRELFRKLEVHDRGEAVRVGFERGLLQPREAA